MNFITEKDNSIVNLDDVKFIDIYGSYNTIEEVSFYLHNGGGYKPYKIYFELKDGGGYIEWEFEKKEKRDSIKKSIQERLK